MHSRLAQRRVEHASRSDRIWATHVIIDDRHAGRSADRRWLAAHQMRRTVGEAVRERRMTREVRLALVGPVRPRRQCVVVVRERLVRPGGRDVATDGAVERRDRS